MTLKSLFFLSFAFFVFPVFAETEHQGNTNSSSEGFVFLNSGPTTAQEENSDTPTVEYDEEEEHEPVPYPQASANTSNEEKKSSEEKEKTPKRPPQKYGDCTGEFWIGQRVISERHAGWGWLKREGESWRSAKWIMLEEKPGSIKAPQRFYAHPEDDNNMQYRLYGNFASYKGYEPNIDSVVDVFSLKGFEVIGEGGKIDRKPPGPTGTRKGRISERERF